MSNKKPKSKQLILPTKEPRKGFDESPFRLRPAWRIGQMEFCDPYGWHVLTTEQWMFVHEKLKNFETMTLNEILGRLNHPVSWDSLVKEVRDRLTERHLDDIEELLSLRVMGAGRIWGILEHNVVILLFWDPEHAICPSLLKYT